MPPHQVVALDAPQLVRVFGVVLRADGVVEGEHASSPVGDLEGGAGGLASGHPPRLARGSGAASSAGDG